MLPLVAEFLSLYSSSPSYKCIRSSADCLSLVFPTKPTKVHVPVFGPAFCVCSLAVCHSSLSPLPQGVHTGSWPQSRGGRRGEAQGTVEVCGPGGGSAGKVFPMDGGQAAWWRPSAVSGIPLNAHGESHLPLFQPLPDPQSYSS